VKKLEMVCSTSLIYTAILDFFKQYWPEIELKVVSAKSKVGHKHLKCYNDKDMLRFCFIV
jgi:hypothetical protein